LEGKDKTGKKFIMLSGPTAFNAMSSKRSDGLAGSSSREATAERTTCRAWIGMENSLPHLIRRLIPSSLENIMTSLSLEYFCTTRAELYYEKAAGIGKFAGVYPVRPKGALECGVKPCPLHASQAFASVTLFYRKAARNPG
jgi:hypothetical protein